MAKLKAVTRNRLPSSVFGYAGVQTVRTPPSARRVESRVVDAIEAPAEDVEIDERGSD
jgi:hypothetical protein